MQIEAQLYVYTESSAKSTAYKQKVRTVTFNLCDEKNPDFRFNVLRQEIPPERIREMQSREMASSAMQKLREQRLKKYEEEQVVCREANPILMVKTHKGEALIEVNPDVSMIDVTGTDLLEVLGSKKAKANEVEPEDDPFNPNTHEVELPELMEQHSIELEGVDAKILAVCRDWRPDVILNKLVARMQEKLPSEQAERIISQIKKPSGNVQAFYQKGAVNVVASQDKIASVQYFNTETSKNQNQ